MNLAVTLGPGFSKSDLVGVALFAVNYAFVAPASALAVLFALVRRRRDPPSWLLAIAGVNLLVALPQLVLFGAEAERWFSALLMAQTVAALGVVRWVGSAR